MSTELLTDWLCPGRKERAPSRQHRSKLYVAGTNRWVRNPDFLSFSTRETVPDFQLQKMTEFTRKGAFPSETENINVQEETGPSCEFPWAHHIGHGILSHSLAQVRGTHGAEPWLWREGLGEDHPGQDGGGCHLREGQRQPGAPRSSRTLVCSARSAVSQVLMPGHMASFAFLGDGCL